jgi:FixJ family two-component response regulator
MTGSDLIAAARRLRPTVSSVLVSGYLGPDVLVRARASGADDVLQKPASLTELADALGRVLRDSADAARAKSLPAGDRRACPP